MALRRDIVLNHLAFQVIDVLKNKRGSCDLASRIHEGGRDTLHSNLQQTRTLRFDFATNADPLLLEALVHRRGLDSPTILSDREIQITTAHHALGDVISSGK